MVEQCADIFSVVSQKQLMTKERKGSFRTGHWVGQWEHRKPQQYVHTYEFLSKIYWIPIAYNRGFSLYFSSLNMYSVWCLVEALLLAVNKPLVKMNRSPHGQHNAQHPVYIRSESSCLACRLLHSNLWNYTYLISLVPWPLIPTHPTTHTTQMKRKVKHFVYNCWHLPI